METRNYSEQINKGLEKIGTHIASEKPRIESGEATEQQVVKESIQTISQSISATATPVTPQAVPEAESLHILPEYAETESPEVKKEIERIVEISANKGIEEGIKESFRYPAYIQDAVHDALVDNLIPELKKRGIL